MVTPAQNPGPRPRWLLATKFSGLVSFGCCTALLTFQLLTGWHRASPWLLGFTLVLVAYFLTFGAATVVALRRHPEWVGTATPVGPLGVRAKRLFQSGTVASVIVFAVGLGLLLTGRRDVGTFCIAAGLAGLLACIMTLAARTPPSR